MTLQTIVSPLIPQPADSAAQLACFMGIVQGVGFRPFVYRLAIGYGLTGWVQNRVGAVYVHVEGDRACLNTFFQEIVVNAPGHASPLLHTLQDVPVRHYDNFAVLRSASESHGPITVPQDTYLCTACISEFNTPENPRYQYPFINCSHCGPRYSIITGMPYDRSNTSMTAFSLCTRCEAEYSDPTNRRFHAEPIACPTCGPKLTVKDHTGHDLGVESTSVVSFIAEQLTAGAIVAMKSVGGYHLLCDATNDTVVRQLRLKKNRLHKPFAVMYPEPQGNAVSTMLASDVSFTDDEWRTLCSDSRPVVLLPKRASSLLADDVAPALACHGVMLPCSALHRSVLDMVNRPLIATSANLSGEPVVINEQAAHKKLRGIADYYVHHDRPIVRPLDDSVIKTSAGALRPIRIGRGIAPLELTLPVAIDRPTLAVGAHQKNTVSLAWNDRLVVSPHIGDLTSVASQQLFDETITDLQRLYGVCAEVVVCDKHSGYASTRWAECSGLDVMRVQHHEAHASAWAFEYGVTEASVVFVWDGVGQGNDGHLWGGEVFYGTPGHWRRMVSFKPFTLQGAEQAGRAPWRSAAALCWQEGVLWPGLEHCDPDGWVHHAWQQSINCHSSSSAGRLFDAAAAFGLAVYTTTYEAQGPMMFESLVTDKPATISLPIVPVNDSFWQIDWAPLLPLLLDTQCSAKHKAEIFHASMAGVVSEVIGLLGPHFPFECVGLTGGVFQNQTLVSWIQDTTEDQVFKITLPQELPVNDGAISIGQIVEHIATSTCMCNALTTEMTE